MNIVLSSGGTVIVPAVALVPGRDVNAGSTALAQIIGHNPMIPAGNDVLFGGNGNDLLVGDDLVISAPVVTFNAAAASRAETITRAANTLTASFSDLVHWQCNLLGGKWTDKESADDRIVIDKLFILGEDTLYGGASNDVLAGENSILVTPQFTITADVSFAFSLFEDGMNRITDELVGASQDLVFLEHRLRDVSYMVLDKNGKNPKTYIEHHIDTIARGSDIINVDNINAGSGDDLVVGDALVVRAPIITITAGATPPVKSKDDWSETEKWSNKGFRSAWWKDWNWNRKDLRQLDRIIVSVDNIDGGSNDLIWGDTLALVNSTVRTGSGVDDKAKFYSGAKKYIDDGE